VRTSPLAIVYLQLSRPFSVRLVMFFYNPARNKQTCTFASYVINAAPSRRWVVCYVAVMVFFVAAFKRRRQHYTGALPDLRQHLIFAGDHCLVRLWHTRFWAPHFAGFVLLIAGMYPARTLMDSYQIGDRRPLASRGWKFQSGSRRCLAARRA